MTDENTDKTTETPAELPDRVIRVSNYPTNANKSKETKTPNYGKPGEDPKTDRPKAKKVVQNDVVHKRRGIGAKIRDAFTINDLHSVGDFIIQDVVIPAIKNTIVDALTQGTERTFFGDSRRGNANRGPGTVRRDYPSYSKAPASSPTGRAGDSDGPRMVSQRGRAAHDFDELVFETRGDADAVLESLSDMIREYNVATVADLYDMAGYTSSFTDNRWGWTTMSGSGITRARNGYLLDLPRPTNIS